MLYGIYSVHDAASGSFGIPFFSVNDQVAQRNFRMLVNDPQAGMIYMHPGDYRLYKIGEYDDQSARVGPLDVVELLITGASCKISADPTPIEEYISNGKASSEDEPSSVKENLSRDGGPHAQKERPGEPHARRHPSVGRAR